MKRIFAVALAALTLFSFTGCSLINKPAAAEEETSSEKAVIEDDRTLEEIAGPKTLAFFEEYNEKDGYAMKCTANASGAELTLYSAIKGEKSYVSVDTDSRSYVVLSDGENLYTLLPESKMAYSMDAGSLEFGSYIQEANNMLFGSTYSEGKITIEGVAYETENYNGPAGEVRYCFKDGEFKYLIVDTEAEYVAIRIDELTKDIDESLFEVPEDYKIR